MSSTSKQENLFGDPEPVRKGYGLKYLPSRAELRQVTDLKNGSDVVRYFGQWVSAFHREELGAEPDFQLPMQPWDARGRKGKAFLRAAGSTAVLRSIRNFPLWVRTDDWRREKFTLDFDTWYRNKDKCLAWGEERLQANRARSAELARVEQNKRTYRELMGGLTAGGKFAMPKGVTDDS